MKTYNINFTAYQVTEPDYGGMQSKHVAYFNEYSDAQKCVDASPAWPRTIKTICISNTWKVYESFEEFDPKVKAERKAEILAKLTQEEQELLGLL